MLQEYEKFPNWLIDVEEGKIWSKRYKKFIGSTDKKDNYVKVQPPKGYKHCKFHQYIWICVNGDIPKGYDIHHIDGNKQNNSIYNLELVEHKKHLSEHKKGNKNWQGKHHSNETKNKISKINKGRIVSEETKRKISKQVVQYTLDGELVKIWDSIMQVEIELKFFNSNIVKCCRGERKTAYGYKWKYKDETEL